jgi:hypothetical protein
VLVYLWAGSWMNADGYPSVTDRWLLLDILLVAITVGSDWYALRHYSREYLKKPEPDTESLGGPPGVG